MANKIFDSKETDKQGYSIQECCNTLREKGELHDIFKGEGNKYEVKTTFNKNNRQIWYKCVVIQNGNEIGDEIGYKHDSLSPFDSSRDNIQGLQSDEIEKKCYLKAKEACETHQDRCDKVKELINPKKSKKNSYIFLIAIFLIVSIVSYLYLNQGHDDNIKPTLDIIGIDQAGNTKGITKKFVNVELVDGVIFSGKFEKKENDHNYFKIYITSVEKYTNQTITLKTGYMINGDIVSQDAVYYEIRIPSSHIKRIPE